MNQRHGESPTVFGHPAGLFTLFFAEMWERFSYYGMRAILIFYTTKGFLGYNDARAYLVYAAYAALVYMTPYFGGMLADGLLGQRLAVIFGGLLMATGQVCLSVPTEVTFYLGLAFLICGNGFFKPNISTIVGSLYPKVSARKDTGFTIFYMGINLGAAMSPVVCGYVGETFGWNLGFGLAAVGILIGVAIFAAPTRVTQVLILGGAAAAAGGMLMLWDTTIQLISRGFLVLALAASALCAFTALSRGGLPPEAGAPPSPERLRARFLGILPNYLVVILGTLLLVPVFVFFVRQGELTQWPLIITGAAALVYILYEAFGRSGPIERHRLFVVLILMFFSLLFWAFFEQAGSSANNYADRNIDRVFEKGQVTAADVGRVIRFRVHMQEEDPELRKLPFLSQEQLGHRNGDPAMKEAIGKVLTRWARKHIEKEARKKAESGAIEPDEVQSYVEKRLAAFLKEWRRYQTLTFSGLTALREAVKNAAQAPAGEKPPRVIAWKIVPENVGMGIADAEIPASEFQAANPIYILLFGLVFSALWTLLARHNLDPSTPFKFALGLLQLGLGFGAFWYGAHIADSRGMVGLGWLLLGYLLHTTGELCLSPVGLSMVTKLSPTRIVSTVMGAWFLATAFSNYLATGVIARFTAVGGEEKGIHLIPPPAETVHLYGRVFGSIALAAIAAAVIMVLLTPLLKRWMHPEAEESS